MGISGRIAKSFLTSQITPLIALVAALMGLFAIGVTPREEEPQINVTMANVFIPFPGASARDVETLVATPAEQVLSMISGIDHVYSVSRPGMAVLTIQYKVGEDRIQALVRLYDTIQSHRDWVSPNLGVGEPIIKPVGIDDVPIVSLTLWTDDPQRGAFELEQVAHAAEIEFKRVKGTREVYTLGGPNRVVRVIMDPEKMASSNVSAQDIKNALQLTNAAQPSGKLVAENQELLVETGTFLTTAQDVKQLVVGVQDNKPVFMTDVAQVLDGPDQPARYLWMGTGPAAKDKAIKDKGEFPAVTLAITKKPGENAVDIADRVMQRVEQLKGTVIPDGVKATVTRNYGETANDKAMKLIQKLIFATSAVVLLVLFALGRREAVIVGVAVLLTLAATLFASWAWGFTLNRVSLFALIFSIGILVDDAIVVVEAVERIMSEEGLSPREAARKAMDQIFNAIIGITLVLTYFVYILLTLKASEKLVKEGHGTEAEEPMFLARIGLPHNTATIVAQLALSLLLLVGGAKGFIHGVEDASKILGITPLLLSLLIIPIATELPEKVNSILWVRRHKDTLAFGNITGAMVFQGTLLPAIGIMLTPWEPRQEVLAGIVITIVAALWLRIMLARGQLRVWQLLVNGGLYVTYLAIALG